MSAGPTSPLPPPPGKIGREELSAFTRQLGAMLEVGVEVLRALRVASRHTGNQGLIVLAGEFARHLEDGRELHEALSRYPAVFDAFYVEMVRQGEADGTLGRALLAIADYLDHLPEGQAVGASVTRPGGRAPQPAEATLETLGRAAVGTALLWSVSNALPKLLARKWVGPLATAWSGYCLLRGSGNVGPTPAPRDGARPIRMPQKSAERRAAETESVVRGALMEQGEAEEATGLSRMGDGTPDFLPDPEDLFGSEDSGR